MIEDLQHLVTLQEIDLRIKEQEVAQEHFPAAVSKLENEITVAATRLEAANNAFKKTEKERNEGDEEVLAAQSGLEKSQDRLNSIKTNREYDAVHAEIETQKHTIANAEHKKDKILAELEKLQSIITEKQAEYDRVKDENEPQIDDLKQKIGAIESTITTITAERDAVEPNISKHIIRQYNLIRKKRKTGKALSIITRTRTCSVCYKVLEPQLFNEIKRGIKVILCQSCGSIMIWDEEAAKEQQ